MKEVNVYSLSIWICIACFLAALFKENWFAMLGFGMAIIANLSSRWFYVRWVRSGRPENSNSLL